MSEISPNSFTDGAEEEEDLMSPNVKFTVIQTGFLTSSVMLVVTLTLCLVVPDLRTTPFSWMKISFLVSITIEYILLSSIMLGGIPLIQYYPLLCTVLGFTTHYFIMCCFFWQNAMSFDIWRKFRRIENQGHQSHEKAIRRFLLYSSYAWGLPLLISFLTILANFLPSKLPKPGHGEVMCYFHDYKSKLFYHHLPVSLLLLANLFFFSLTVKAIFCGVWVTRDSHSISRPGSQSLTIVVCLFVITGLPWVSDSVTGSIQEAEQHIVAFFFDTVNAFNGLIIFLIFIVKNPLVSSVKKLCQEPEISNSGIVTQLSLVSRSSAHVTNSLESN